MQLVFDARQHELPQRRDLWQEALCSAYIALDAELPGTNGYQGSLCKADFGPVSITDIQLSPHRIRRRKQHLARLDKDCYYLQILQKGRAQLAQGGHELPSNPAVAALFYSGEPYDLQCLAEMRALYLEIPRESLKSRMARQDLPIAGNVSIGNGIGKLAAQLCANLVAESLAIAATDKPRLGAELLNIVALVLDRDPVPDTDGDPHRLARLSLIQSWIEQHLSDPGLSLEAIAKYHHISVRLLHHLFREVGASPADWIWSRRLQKCHDLICSQQELHRSITDIAYSLGFSSSSHFSNAFKAKFGMRPSEARRK
ncbi:helix-turn-helix domain-containing protein [Achromobacter sp. SD115]|uniref:AraC-like ligand-binding domain-containing protein n=1 Tax=Achromobacter sp. SD115 TaxID=2782011 RepID=UPI001A95F248|nr:helix-turn-helix domain-containing protein [Achromobacter sp. SD115]MBO1012501.1 helix-turn-helix domain-containing protein [Achromobacter sp. SD115]